MLAVGDTLLLQGTWGALEERLDDPEVLVVDAPELVRRQACRSARARSARSSSSAAMVVLLATGAVPPAVAGLLAAGAIVLLRRADDRAGLPRHLLDDGRPRRRDDPALDRDDRDRRRGESSPTRSSTSSATPGRYALLLGLFVLTAVLGQLISNMATALIVIPIALSAAADVDVSARPVLMCVTVAAAAAFLTPVATPANLMVMEPGGYRFGDYWKLGLPLLVLYGVVAVLLVPVFWPF